MSALIHCITNPISMNHCANVILSLGASPVMAEHPGEVKEITDTAAALLLNLGNISDTRMASMKISFAAALEKGIPAVIDAVGVACSQLRRDFFFELMKEHESGRSFLLIKGNYSEIKALYDDKFKGIGVDADGRLMEKDIAKVATALAKQLGAVILATGKTDIVADGGEVFFIKNGHPYMSRITGTGCMLGAICAAFLGRSVYNRELLQKYAQIYKYEGDGTESACEVILPAKEKRDGSDEFQHGHNNRNLIVLACAFFGITGERAYEKIAERTKRVGSGSYLCSLLDEISLNAELEE
ncbi:hydroxyethylthiazole kinase [Butyrivibrio sp. YAB3001]|uniref:hydroxyethylthiazole kinase n=1 Tax=Butyrivibrio sp. YAB3001 TaxID=1520812 RepID=UPI0008F62405|nr:hydroxyethylthiazole kinase [Butyrivibrio sp. YAB3001]SFD06632.1 hydroxyethylthiazole kinase [Butyrivibrio sp. YAB3001]